MTISKPSGAGRGESLLHVPRKHPAWPLGWEGLGGGMQVVQPGPREDERFHPNRELRWKRGPNAASTTSSPLDGKMLAPPSRPAESNDPNEVPPWQPRIPCSVGLDEMSEMQST